MSAKNQHNNILLAILGFSAVVALVAAIGYFTLTEDPEIIQGEVEVEEYRVSSKLPGRIIEIKVNEGDTVQKGDVLAIIEAPEVEAQQHSAEATHGAAEAMHGAAEALSDMADNGARSEQIESAAQLLRQAEAANDIAQKTFSRMQRLYDEGVVSAQKRDEAEAAFKASQAQVGLARSQYDMARNGARNEERRAAHQQAQAARQQAQAAQGAVDLVKSIKRETVQVATARGVVTNIYPKVGELVSIGSPIMTVSMTDDTWGSFNVREDQLSGLKVGDTFTAYVPAFDTDINLRVYDIKDEGSYAVWKATKTVGQYDLKTFEVKARPVKHLDGLRPGMSLILKDGIKKKAKK